MGIFRHVSSRPTVPKPTWSVKSLQLDHQHEPVSEETLQKLSRRALIDVSQLSQSRQDQLRQDLGNMLHLIDRVQQVGERCKIHEQGLSDADMYDVPRGVTSIPLRQTEHPSVEEEQEAKHVFESLMKDKTVQVGAHTYFEVVTARQETK